MLGLLALPIIAAFTNRESVMQGFYALFYTGIAGFGHAVLIIKDGQVIGADASGGIYDGTYEPVNNDISFKVKLTMPAGTTLVTGQSLTEEITQNIITTLPSHLGNGAPVTVYTEMGPVNVIFKKLRDAQ